MKYQRLGKSGIVVSEICLGTMTFGSSCNEAQAFEILNYAFESGVDFLDTAEIYPVPPRSEWVHETERILGKWLKTRSRDAVIIASKVAGPGHGWFRPPLRDGKTCLDRRQIIRAIEGSLSRLQTDYIDLYQTHWPDHDANNYEEILSALDDLYVQGKIRIAGSSNETPWGVMKAQAASERTGCIRYETIQNNYSILNRRFEDALSDICQRESISLLPYSPLGGGVVSGKYNGGKRPEGARFTKYLSQGERQQKMASRFVNEKSLATVEALHPIAESLGISTVTLAIAWCRQKSFVASTIVGANTVAQLEESLKAVELELTPEVLKSIDSVTESIPYPMG
jgi:aryl-alcohol dehydrogenase-like predicted oxidoreductase